MRRENGVNREAPARRGHRSLALAYSVALAAFVALAVFSPDARAANNGPQSSSNKSSTSKSSGKTSSKKKKVQHRREPIQKAPTPDRIQEIQTALNREGYYREEPSGKWDTETQDALRRFQEEHGMTGSGKLDATTLQKLGLGSDIAGVSAPKPPVQHPNMPPPPDVTPPSTPSATSVNSNPGS
jgi:murein L,D-transpeptidase YcbB/YkuD